MDKVNIIKEKYNQTAQLYADTHEKRMYWLQNPRKTIVKFLNENNIDLVVDIGCGSGVMINSLYREFPKIKFIGLDISSEMIKIANNNKNKNVEFFTVDLLKDKEYVNKIINYGGSENILFLLIGTMAYYDKNDETAQNIFSLWQGLRRGSIFATFHNKELFCRSVLKQGMKKYWKGAAALDYYGQEYEHKHIRYFSFVLFDFFASIFELRFLDRFFLWFDHIVSLLPISVSKKITTNFEILIEK